MQNRAFLPTRLRNKEYCFYVGWGTLREKKDGIILLRLSILILVITIFICILKKYMDDSEVNIDKLKGEQK